MNKKIYNLNKQKEDLNEKIIEFEKIIINNLKNLNKMKK